MNRERVLLPNGQVISYLVDGPIDGEPTVLLHGGGTDSAELSWEPTLRVLSQHGYRVYVPDHPGFGYSPLPRKSHFNMAFLLDYLSHFVDELGLETFDLGGVSMGGAMTLGYTLAHPERVRRLLLVATYGVQGQAPVHPLSMVGVNLPGISLASRAFAWNRPLLEASMRVILSQAPITTDLLDKVQYALVHTSAMKAFNQFQRSEMGIAGNRTDYRKRLHEITHPVLMIQGLNDVAVNALSMRRAAKMLPNAQLYEFPGAAHWTQRDVPELFHKVLLEFLHGPEGPSPSAPDRPIQDDPPNK